MKNVNWSIPFISALGFGLFLSLALVWAFWQPAQAEPVVLFAAPTASGSGDCSDWNNACALNTALANALSGEQVWVKMGVYKPGVAGERGNSFALKPGVEVYGGFAGTEDELTERDWETNLTVLSGDIDSNDTTDAHGVVTQTANINGENSYHVLNASSPVTESARLDGFVITAGQANSVSVRSGGGMDNVSADPTLANLLFRGNLADRGGGMHNDTSSPTLLNVTFNDNLADTWGGGMANFSSSPTLTNVTFITNTSAWGGGMYNTTSSPILTDVSFNDNRANASGGGLYNYDSSSPTLVSVTFNDNYADYNGGGMYSQDSAPGLTEVSFSRNSADTWGGGMYNENSSPVLRDVIFDENSAIGGGGGMFNYDNSSPTLTNVIFSSNKANFGGGMQNKDSNPILINGFFSANSVTYHGGAIYNDAGHPELVNVTFSGNTADNSGGGIYSQYSYPKLTNVILWGDSAATGPEIYNLDSTPVISYSLIEGSGGSGINWNSALGTDGGGNIDADPLFYDGVAANLRLMIISPAIDAGDNDAVPAGVITDLDGNARFVNIPGVPDSGHGTPPIVDMGAYECWGMYIYLPVILR